MASENETVVDIVNEMRRRTNAGDGIFYSMEGRRVMEMTDRIEAAHKRELEEKQAQIDDGVRKFNEIDNMLQEERAKVAELRECLMQAYGDKMGTYTMIGIEVPKWRKVLEGTKNEDK